MTIEGIEHSGQSEAARTEREYNSITAQIDQGIQKYHTPAICAGGPEKTPGTARAYAPGRTEVAGKRLRLLHPSRYPVCSSESEYRVQGAVKEGRAAGYPLSRPVSQRGDPLP